MSTWLLALENSGLAVAVREGAWTYPAVQTLHLLGVAGTLGAAGLFDLRLLGAAPRLSVADLSAWLHPIALGSGALAAATGGLLFAADAVALSTNRALHLKLLALLVAGANAWIFRRHWRAQGAVPRQARLAATISLSVWLTALASGRLIAYVG